MSTVASTAHSDGLDATDRRIINGLQGGFPVCERPYAKAAADLGLTEGELLERLQHLVAAGYLSRFAPLFDVERLGGAVMLAAMAVPPQRLETVIAQVNAHPEVAHNYERDHRFNLWFVISVLDAERLEAVAAAIEAETGLTVYRMPKEREFYLRLRVEA